MSWWFIKKGWTGEFSTMDEKLPKEKKSIKHRVINAPKITVLYSSTIIGCKFLMPIQEYVQKFQVHIVKIICDHKKSYHKTLITPSSYVLLMIINIEILCHTATLSIKLQTKRMKIFCGNSNVFLPMIDRLINTIPTPKDIFIMWWLNWKHGRIPLKPYLSSHKMTLSHVIYMLMIKFYYNSRDGNYSDQ